MVLTNKYLASFTLLLVGLISLHCANSESWLSDKNLKKANRTVSKIWKNDQLQFQPMQLNSNFLEDLEVYELNGSFFSLESSEQQLGTIYIGTANGCHVGGCESPNNASNGFENFDFMLVYNESQELINVQVLRYDCEYGYEICGKRWLRQFSSKQSSENYNYGQDIQALSGATISAKSITHEINTINKIIRSY